MFVVVVFWVVSCYCGYFCFCRRHFMRLFYCQGGQWEAAVELLKEMRRLLGVGEMSQKNGFGSKPVVF